MLKKLIRRYLQDCQDSLVCDRIRTDVEVAIGVICDGVFGLPVSCSWVIPVRHVHAADLEALPVFHCRETVLQSANAKDCEQSRSDGGARVASGAGTHGGGAELWSVVVDVRNVNDRHTFAGESLARHVGDL